MDKLQLNYAEFGHSGRPLIMLHGWGHSIDSLQELAEILSSDAKVYVVDLPGFGESPEPPQDWGSLQYAESIRQFIVERDLRDVTVFGHSFGGQVAMQLSNMEPERVTRLILLNSAGIKRELKPQEARKFGLIRKLRGVIKWIDATFHTNLFETWFIPKFGSEDYKNAGRLRPILVKSVNEDLTEVASKIRARVFLLWGETDTATPIGVGRKLHSLIQGSRLVVLPGRGHIPFKGTGAHLCAYHIRPFLKEVA